MHLYSKEYKKSNKLLYKVLDLERDSAEIWSMIALNNLMQKKYNKAVECAEKALSVDPKKEQPLLIIGAVNASLNKYNNSIADFPKSNINKF
ncbi:tetratricopeptide repeat protein [Selenomonas sp. ND2010]|uniref:tetratricopeptide repeat protein n=1 Tax=Selenomonas sp. ND2010 TaxID=1410618 RepID=UPI00051BA4E8|nr:tetratricopeptide repeat protein [Selenomonas sp. ND2010]